MSAHCSSLHCLTHRFTLSPDTVETLLPTHHAPSSKNPWSTHIAANKEDAKEEHTQLTDLIQIYSNGSGHKGCIRAAAVLFRAGRAPRSLHYHLSTEEEHTVFEAKEVGLTLAARLLATEQDLTFPISISVDNQASIQAGESFHSCPGSYIADHFCRMMKKIAKEYRDFDITLRWVPGHSNVHGNEEADKHAKLAAESRGNNSPNAQLPKYLRQHTLPLSISALKEAHNKITSERWKTLWRNSPHFHRFNQLDPQILKCSFVKLTATFPRRLTSLYLFLCTGHAPLNKHLHRIHRAASPFCTHCPHTEETVHHYLTACSHHRRAQHLLIGALGHKATSVQYLLTDPDATPHLVIYVNATGRFRPTLGEVPLPHAVLK